jgi:hypothetical protein
MKIAIFLVRMSHLSTEGGAVSYDWNQHSDALYTMQPKMGLYTKDNIANQQVNATMQSCSRSYTTTSHISLKHPWDNSNVMSTRACFD